MISCRRFVEEVEEVLRLSATAAHPEGKGVALHTPLSLYGASYRYVFTLGLTEGGFPTSIADDPALDFHERKRLRERDIRLELADERARRERLSFWTLLQVPQERLVLSYPKLVGGAKLSRVPTSVSWKLNWVRRDLCLSPALRKPAEPTCSGVAWRTTPS